MGSLLRLLAAGYSLFFTVGYLQWWLFLLQRRSDHDGEAVFWPWVFLPFFASAGLAAGFAIWGPKRLDRVGQSGQLAMGLVALYYTAVILVDLYMNSRPSLPAETKFLTLLLLGFLLISAVRQQTSGGSPWLPVAKMLLAAVTSVVAVFIGNSSIAGWRKALGEGFRSWGYFTTPVVVALSIVGTIATITLVVFAWQIQFRSLPAWAARIIPAQWQ